MVAYPSQGGPGGMPVRREYRLQQLYLGAAMISGPLAWKVSAKAWIRSSRTDENMYNYSDKEVREMGI